MPAKGTVKFKITQQILEKVENLAARGLDHEDIALSLGIARGTLFALKKRNADFDDAIRRGKSKGKTHLLNATFRRALNDKHPKAHEAARFLLTHSHGMHETVHQHHTGAVAQVPVKPKPARTLTDAELEAIIQGKPSSNKQGD
jgi:hypothetical protein